MVLLTYYYIISTHTRDLFRNNIFFHPSIYLIVFSIYKVKHYLILNPLRQNRKNIFLFLGHSIRALSVWGIYWVWYTKSRQSKSRQLKIRTIVIPKIGYILLWGFKWLVIPLLSVQNVFQNNIATNYNIIGFLIIQPIFLVKGTR